MPKRVDAFAYYYLSEYPYSFIHLEPGLGMGRTFNSQLLMHASLRIRLLPLPVHMGILFMIP